MMWQDGVIAFGNIAFIIALLPTIVEQGLQKKSTIPFLTSVPTMMILYMFSVTFFTMELYFSSMASIVLGYLWFVIVYQQYAYKRKI